MDREVLIVIALLAIVDCSQTYRIKDINNRVKQLENPCQHLEDTDEFGECIDRTVRP